MAKKITPETYRDLKIIKTTVRVAAGKMPQLVTRLKCDIKGHLLESDSWRDLELQIDEHLDKVGAG
ncbi:MAG: hypothetical protein AB7O59_16275 [Pirellulales bacterium]